MRLAVIATMKKGLEHFVARELEVFTEQGCQIKLFPTKYGPGLYQGHSDWELYRWQAPGVILAQPLLFALKPILYLKLLLEALATRSLVDFLLACYFAPRMHDVDAIYATFGDHKLYVGYYCKRILGKPLAVKIHAYELYQNPNPRLFQRALADCDQIMTVTEHNKELLTSQFHIDASRIDVVRISVDVEAYRPSEKFIVLIVAFFAERKGHEVLFRAVRQLARDDIEVWVVGDEGLEGSTVDVRRLAKEIGVEPQVAFFGKLGGQALQAVYRACDVFCLPCRQDQYGICEGFPTVLAEAMAFGKPVITTRHVEIPRIVDRVLVDENDVAGLARALDHLSRSPELCREQGAANRETAKRHFTNANAVETLQLISRVGPQRMDESRPPDVARCAMGSGQDEVLLPTRK